MMLDVYAVKSAMKAFIQCLASGNPDPAEFYGSVLDIWDSRLSERIYKQYFDNPAGFVLQMATDEGLDRIMRGKFDALIGDKPHTIHNQVMDDAGAFAEKAANPGDTIVHVKYDIKHSSEKLKEFVKSKLISANVPSDHIDSTMNGMFRGRFEVNYAHAVSVVTNPRAGNMITFGFGAVSDLTMEADYKVNKHDIGRGFSMPFNVSGQDMDEITLYHELIGHGTEPLPVNLMANNIEFYEVNNELRADICGAIAYAVRHNNLDACQADIAFRDIECRDKAFTKEIVKYAHGLELEQAVDALGRILADPLQKARLLLLTPHEIALLGDYWTYLDFDRLYCMGANAGEMQNIFDFIPPCENGLAATKEELLQRTEAIQAIHRDGKDLRDSSGEPLSPEIAETAQNFLHRAAVADALFFRESVSDNPLLESILRECPRLRGQAFHYPQAGINARTIIFPTEVFKGPLRNASMRFFDQEYRVLDHIAGKVRFVPELTYVGRENIFFGMRKMPGVMLQPDLFSDLSAEQQNDLAKEIAGFIHEFASAFSQQDAKKILRRNPRKPPSSSTIAETLAHPGVREYLQDDLLEASKAMREYLERIGSSKEVVVFHKDLSNENILINPENKKLSGILDFGFGGVCIGPIEEGFACLHRAFPHSFVHEICQQYEVISGKSIEYRDVVLCDIAETLSYLRSHVEHGKKDNPPWFKENIRACLEEIATLEMVAFIPRTPAFSAPKML